MLNTHTFFNYTLTKWGKKTVWLRSIHFGPTKTLSSQIDEKTREKMEKWVLDKIGPAASHVFLSLFFLLFVSFRCPFIIYLFLYFLYIYFCTHHLLFFFSFLYYHFSIFISFFLYFLCFGAHPLFSQKILFYFIFWERNFGFLNFLCFIKKLFKLECLLIYNFLIKI